MKKLLSLGLALVMCLALAIPALAEEQTFSTENSAMTPTIEVDLPASAAVILNPYGMTYTVTGTAPAGITNNTTDQIISNIFYITNKTKGCNLEVKCTVTGDAGGNAEFVAATTDNKVFEDDAAAAAANAVIQRKFKSTETGNKVVLVLSYNCLVAQANAAPGSLSGTRTTNYTKIITDSEQDLETIVLGPSNGTKHTYVMYQFSGIAVSKPEEAWTENDTVGATFVYTFTATPDAVTTAS